MGHIPCEITGYVYFFVKEENRNVFGTIKSLGYKVPPITSGGLEAPLSLTFSCKWEINTMKEFAENIYSFEHSRSLHLSDDTNVSDDEEDNHHQTITIIRNGRYEGGNR